MSDAPAVLQATYVKWQMIASRKVLVLSFEMPLEAQAHVQEVLGTPMPDQSNWVAIARLKEGVETIDTLQEPKAIEMKGGKLAQRAGMLSNSPLFVSFCRETYRTDDPVQAIYDHCGVDSRKSLDNIPKAGERFLDMVSVFEAWKRL